MRIRAHHYATGQLIDIVTERRTIGAIGPAGNDAPDLGAGWVAPALFDLQINGCDGYSFNSPELTIDNVRHVVEVCRRHGIGGLCPTLVTNGYEALAHGMSVI